VVLCHALAHEIPGTYRAMRGLAQRLAAAGFPVLRFDYTGTGDSAGDEYTPGLVARWLDDVELAAAEVRRLSGASHLALAGVRVGALLAGAVAGRLGADALVLWSPCSTGRAWVREARAFARLRAQGGPDADAAPLEVAGFVLPDPLLEGLAGLSLRELPAGAAPRVLLLERDDLPGDPAVAAAFQRHGAEVERQLFSGGAELLLSSLHAPMPDAALSAIVSWLAGAAPELAGTRRTPLRSRARAMELEGVRETVVRFGPERRLVGVLTEPLAASGGPRPAILLPNVAGDPHTGPHRMWVTLGRAWARRGYRVLRFALSGLGESAAAAGAPEYELFPAAGIEDLAAAAEWLGGGGDDVVLVGLCSGGWFGVHAVLAGVRFAECIAINPQLYWRQGMPIHGPGFGDAIEGRRLAASARKPWKWARLLTGRVPLRALIRTVVRNWKVRLRHWLRPTLIDSELRALARGDVPVVLIFGGDDPGLIHLEREAPHGLRRLRARRDAGVVVMAGADHSFQFRCHQHRLVDWLDRRLAARYERHG
jgi:dienelactone hydrolase